jgi:soluble lytic murein transglycosylase-like protein
MAKLESAALGIALVVMLTSNSAIGQSAGSGVFDEHAMFSMVGAMYGLDPALLEAIATVESHGDPNAVSPAGALGLMQLMPATAERFFADAPLDPVESALGAARFLCYLKRNAHIRTDLPDLLAAYNAGEGTVVHYKGVPPYPETREYVRRVLWLYLFSSPLPRQTSGKRAFTSKGPNITVAPRSETARRPEQGDRAMLDQLGELARQRAQATAAR